MASTPLDTWQDRARNTLKIYYESFGGVQWHEFDLKSDEELLKVKICFAIYGPPTNSKATKLEEAYSDDRKKSDHAEEILRTIGKIKSGDVLNISFAFVVCHDDKARKEFTVPVFSVHTPKSDPGCERLFVDTQSRVYKNWDDWKENNTLPKVQLAYPKDGHFTCRQDGLFGYDPKVDPVVEFGESPQCSGLATAKTVGDIASAITSFGKNSYHSAFAIAPQNLQVYIKSSFLLLDVDFLERIDFNVIYRVFILN